MVPGARIELATPAFSGRRSTNELPRHKGFRNCMVHADLCQFGEKRNLLLGLIEFAHPVAVLEDFSRFGTVRRADDSVFLH